jgi:hypothetical protein
LHGHRLDPAKKLRLASCSPVADVDRNWKHRIQRDRMDSREQRLNASVLMP